MYYFTKCGMGLEAFFAAYCSGHRVKCCMKKSMIE